MMTNYLIYIAKAEV